jgi:hypothetical protein
MDDIDQALHDIGRHLGVQYDAQGYALPSEHRPLLDARERQQILAADLARQRDEARQEQEAKRRRNAMRLVTHEGSPR